ncbi:MAG: histidine kinase [Bacteroidales bacterium]|nr:histidine kinase [Bacteroidales bacterium]
MFLNAFKYLIFCALFVSFTKPAAAQIKKDPVIDSLEKVLQTRPSDSSWINTMIRLANRNTENNNFRQTETLLSEIDAYCLANNIQPPYRFYWSRADLHFKRREIRDALQQMILSIEKMGDNPPQVDYAKAQNFLALLLLYDGQFAKSIDTYENNKQYIQDNDIGTLLTDVYSGLSAVYRNTGDVEMQRKYLEMMAESATLNNQKKQAANAWLRLGDLGMEKDSNFIYAIENYQKSLDLYKKLQDSGSISFVILRIGWNHYLDDNLDSALFHFFNSLEYSLPINRLTSITNAYGNIGTIYRDLGEYDKAIKYYKESIDYSLIAEDWYNLSWLYKDMSMMYETRNDYREAYLNLLKHKQFSDSLDMQRYRRGLSEARTRYEAEKAKSELEFLTLKLQQHKYLTYGFAGLIFLTVVIGYLLFRQFRSNSKRKLSEMNHKVSEVTQRNLRQQMNPHFIFNTLNSIQYYMYQHDKISTNNYLTKFSLLMRKTLENSQHTSIPIKDELDALELYLELESLRFKEKFEYSIEVHDDIDTMLMKIPTMLIQPYVENAISHGIIHKKDKGKVKITLEPEGNMIICTIEDNGIGREASMKQKKNGNNNHNSLGTKITESRLTLVNSLYGRNMKIDYSDLKDEQGLPAGTRVIIHIPIIT